MFNTQLDLSFSAPPPWIRDKKTFLHILNHPDKLIHGYWKSEYILGNERARPDEKDNVGKKDSPNILEGGATSSQRYE